MGNPIEVPSKTLWVIQFCLNLADSEACRIVGWLERLIFDRKTLGSRPSQTEGPL